MTSERPLTLEQRRFLAYFLGAVPAIAIGFCVGLLASGIGSERDPDPVSILVRGLICAAPLAFLTSLSPRLWLFPSFIYGFGFYFGYTFNDNFIDLSGLAAIPCIP